MKNRILEIVIFLMDFLKDKADNQTGVDVLSLALKDLGYSEQEISTAYSWFLEQFNGSSNQYFSDFPQNHSSTRVLTTAERMKISPDAHGFLMKLLNNSLIKDEQLEMIIEKVSAMVPDSVSLEQMKLIASSVIFKEFENYEDLNIIDTGSHKLSIIN